MEQSRLLTLLNDEDELIFLLSIVVEATDSVKWGSISLGSPIANLTQNGVLRFLVEEHVDKDDHRGRSIEVFLIPPLGYTKDFDRWWEVPGFRFHLILNADCPNSENMHLVWEIRDDKSKRPGFCPSCRSSRFSHLN